MRHHLTGNGSTSWHNDYSNFPGNGYPFSARGGRCKLSEGAGLFYFSVSSGTGTSEASFHPVLVAL